MMTISSTPTVHDPTSDVLDSTELPQSIGPFPLNTIVEGDCRTLARSLPSESIDIIVTSPPYWGQRTSAGVGVEDDPRDYVSTLVEVFSSFLPALKPEGLLWINIGDSYNTPVNWRLEDRRYSTLGPDRQGLADENSAYTKPRQHRKAYVKKKNGAPWLTYGNLLALPYRLVTELTDRGFLFRGEVIWRKKNPMPEGKARRPHRHHESIYLLAKAESHRFRTTPPVPSVWEFPNEKVNGEKHFSRFPEELPKRCIEAYGVTGSTVVVLDPFSGSGTTGVAALRLGCSYLGFEIEPAQVRASNQRLIELTDQTDLPLT